jgi:peroxiredoxin Q/BCP
MREFRVHHAEFVALGASIAGVSLESPERNREWAARLELPYPLISDVDRRAGRAFHVLNSFGIGAWKLELFRRSTFLADRDGRVRAVWGAVRPRGHAEQVLVALRALPSGK